MGAKDLKAKGYMQELDKIMFYVCYPGGILGGIYATLLGFGVIRAGIPDKGDELSLAKRLKLCRWLGPVIIILSIALIVMTLIGVK